MIQIPFKTLKIFCEPIDELYLPEFKGSSFRGIIGRTLKSALCILKTQSTCYNCPLVKDCYYNYLFETIPDKSRPLPFNLHKYPSIPHPFVIEPPEEKKILYKRGETFSLKIILIGKAVAYEPHFILAMRLAGEHGIGKGNKKFIITDCSSTGTLNQLINFDLSNQKLESNNFSKITFQFITPLRLVYQKKLVKTLEFHHIIRALLRRISILYYFHVSEDMSPIPAKELINLSENIKTFQSNLKWFDWERYSYRQNRRMILGGLIGQIVFEGNLSPFHDLLKAGEIFHCGKNTSFGLGKYKLIF